jgi:hypothetical protein
MRFVGVVLALAALAVAPAASAASAAAPRACLAKSGAKTVARASSFGPEVDATWRTNSVEVFTLSSHQVALAFAEAGRKAGKPAASNVVAGRMLATFYRVPTHADLNRVKPCLTK